MKITFTKVVNIVVVLIIIGALGYAVIGGRDDTTTYSEDTTIEHSLVIADGERIVIHNAATLSVQGDLDIQGRLSCINGPLTVVITGTLTVSGEITCNRARELYPSDPQYGINLVAMHGFQFTKDAILATNSHVQLVVSPDDLLSTKESIQQKYDEVVLDIGGDLRIGPFVPVPLAGGQEASFAPPTGHGRSSLFHKLFPLAFAQGQDTGLADEIPGDLEKTASHISGRFIIGDPAHSIHNRISVPHPPKDVNSVLVSINIPEQTLVLENLELFTSSGRPGVSDLNRDCDARGGDGLNASRVSLVARRMIIDDFELHLGDGGKGGDGETLRDCAPATAMGGNGGMPGNVKITAQSLLALRGDFILIPGTAGSGGSGVAHGVDAGSSCPANPGGDAFAHGGIGGDNKMGLKLAGTDQITGIDAIIIKDFVAGNGGTAVANGGNGGSASICGCAGGSGGSATAEGGNGGTATSRTVNSIGGNGGNVSTVPGVGGSGGSCGSDQMGGDGGSGGSTNVTVGNAGSGRTKNGTPGSILRQAGADGGQGGDGCSPGQGGPGGLGEPDGQTGTPGINLCGQDIITPNAGSTNESRSPSASNPPLGTTPSIVPLMITPEYIAERHTIFVTECPQHLATLALVGTDGYNWELVGESPVWLDLGAPRGVVPLPYKVDVSFNCNINEIDSHLESGTLSFRQVNTEHPVVQVPVVIEIINQNDSPQESTP